MPNIANLAEEASGTSLPHLQKMYDKRKRSIIRRSEEHEVKCSTQETAFILYLYEIGYEIFNSGFESVTMEMHPKRNNWRYIFLY